MSLDSSSDYFKMGKITLEMLAKSPSHTKKRRDETVQQYARRLTHLYFSEKNIDEIVSRPVWLYGFIDFSILLARSVSRSLFVNLLDFDCFYHCASRSLYSLINCSMSLQHINMQLNECFT